MKTLRHGLTGAGLALRLGADRLVFAAAIVCALAAAVLLSGLIPPAPTYM